MSGHDNRPLAHDSQIAGDAAEDMGGFEDIEGIDELMLLDGGDGLPLSEIDYQEGLPTDGAGERRPPAGHERFIDFFRTHSLDGRPLPAE
jgi:hypothetical protein